MDVLLITVRTEGGEIICGRIPAFMPEPCYFKKILHEQIIMVTGLAGGNRNICSKY